MKTGPKLALLVVLCLALLTACSSPEKAQVTAPAQTALEPDFSTQSWLEAWGLLKAKWGITGESYVQSLSFRTEGERLIGINLVVWAKQGENWLVCRYDREQNYGPAVRKSPLHLIPDQQKIVEADRFFAELEPFSIKEFSYPNAEMGYTSLIIKPDEGVVLAADADSELYLLTAGKKTSPVPGHNLIVDDRQVLLHSNPVGKSQTRDKERRYLILNFSGEVSASSAGREANTAKAQAYGYRLVDLNGDQIREELTLWGFKSAAEEVIPEKWQLVIKQGEVKKSYPLALKNAFQGVGLTVKDLTADGKPEVIIEEYVGGSGNINYLHIYQVENGQLKTLFESEPYAKITGVENSYLGNNRVRVSIKPLKLLWEYDLIISNYDPADKTREKEVQEQFSKEWVDPFSGYEFIDLNGDGRVEIVGSQMVCGQAHVDIVGILKQVFVFDGKKFNRQGIDLYRAIDYGEEKVSSQ